MASTQKTEFLQLNKWNGEDYLERVDMNTDNAAIDEFAKKVDREVQNLQSEKANVVDTNRKIAELQKELNELAGTAADEETVAEIRQELDTLSKRIIQTNTEVGKKADKEYVDAELKKKATVTAMNNKADSSRVTKLEDEMQGVKQSGLNGKNQLETSIKSKGGRVNKAGEVATFDELDSGVKSIITDPSIGTTNAKAGDLLEGKTAISDGKRVTGSMPHNGDLKQVISRQGQKVDLKPGYYSGGSVQTNIHNLKPENIVKGETVGGVVGKRLPLTVSPTYVGESMSVHKNRVNTSTLWIDLKLPGKYEVHGTASHKWTYEQEVTATFKLDGKVVYERTRRIDGYDGIAHSMTVVVTPENAPRRFSISNSANGAETSGTAIFKLEHYDEIVKIW